MRFLDINTFFFASDGGIKTFYSAKIDWFRRHPEHQYHLVFPGPAHCVNWIAPNICLFQVYGFPDIIGRNRRLMIGYVKILKLIRRVRPQVIEAGDPFFTSAFCAILQRFGLFRGVLSCFHHSSPVETYLIPWVRKPGWRLFKRGVTALASKVFYGIHRRYPYNMVASQTLKTTLAGKGIRNIAVMSFGVSDSFCFPERRVFNRKLLFAGRLEHEKGIHLLRSRISRILNLPGVELTVMGKGMHEDFFQSFQHPRMHFLGYVADRDQVAEVYREHTYFLAPGPHETFGIGVLEALANGMIIIGPDSGGTGEFLKSMHSPFRFQADNADDFLACIHRALEADPQIESRRSLNFSMNFESWDAAIGHMIHHYQATSQIVKPELIVETSHSHIPS